MPINILVTNTKYFTEYKNDVGFVSNLGDFANNLQGSVMENVKLVRELTINWFAQSSLADRFAVDTALNTITRKGGGNFLNDGASVGDVFDFTNQVTTTPNIIFEGQIQSVSATQIVYTVLSGAPVNDPNGYGDAELRFKTPLTALVYKFGLIENAETFNVISKVSGNEQAYYGSNIGFDTGGGVRDTNFVTLSRLGQYEDWRTGTVKARFSQQVNDYIQKFEIEHEFTLVPYYVDGQLTNLQNNVIPSLLNGLNSLKYVFNPEFRTVLSNPNTAKSYDFDINLGSTAWFNENFNGFNSEYKVNSIDYTEFGTVNAADGLLIGGKTTVTIQVERLNGNFVLGDKVGVYVSYLPEQAEYTNTTISDLKENFIYDNAFETSGNSGANGQDFITNMSVFAPVGALMSITFDVEYNNNQKAFLSGKLAQSTANFLIGVQLGDNTLTNQASDRTILLADVNEYDESADIPDLMHVNKYDIYAHNEPIGLGDFSTDKTTWNEDGLVIDFSFDLDLNKQAVLNSLEFKLVAYNPITNQFWDLDTYSFSPATAIVSGGVQQINDITTRGYILKANDQFNDVQIGVGTNVGGIQNYDGRFAQKISWQDWIQNLDVDTIFYDALEPNNNLNNKASNYSLLNDYEIRLAIFGNVSGVSTLNVSGVTDYLFLSPTITVYDYEKDGNIPAVWSAEIETFDAINLTNLGGAILTGQDTLFRTTWTNSNGAVTSLVDIWGINRIEETNQQGYAITEMSSLNEPAANQILIPQTGTKLLVYLNAGKVVFECKIDGNQVVAGTNYNLSSRIQDETLAVFGKITEGGTQKDTEDDQNKIPEQ